MNTHLKLILAAGLAVSAIGATSAFAQGPAAPVTRLATVTVVGKKLAAEPVTRLETVVVVGHRIAPAPLEATNEAAAHTTLVVYRN